MRRVAIIFNGDLRDRKGYINAVLERAKRLSRRSEYCVDVYCLSTYDHWFVRKLRHSDKVERVGSVEVDGLTINMIWLPFSLLDYILSIKLNMGRVVEPLLIKQEISRFKNYDLISAHSTVPGEVALWVNKQYGVPYTITWHGSDIHTSPFINSNYKTLVTKIMRGAVANMFVSKALCETAYKFNPQIPMAKISYNGASEGFRRLTAEECRAIRAMYGVEEGEKVVGFVGGLVPVKNADKLPEIFHYIAQRIKNVKFWIVGDGMLRGTIESKLKNRYPKLDCRLLGNQQTDKMPALMNCIDVLVLPSENEGLPLVAVEALRCATNVVASNVGGISEVVGECNVVNHGERFIERFGERCVEILKNEEPAPELPKQFDWDVVVAAEENLYNLILKI